jgi:acyl-coenzyme A synthetase/AMP-(fatty) acid ligase
MPAIRSRRHARQHRRQAAAAAGLPADAVERRQRFRDAYLDEFPGYYKTSDAGFMDEDGYLFIMARTDDIINVAGHRLSTGGMEEVIARAIPTSPNAPSSASPTA